MKKFKRARINILATTLAIGIVATQLFGVAAPAFADVPTTHWAYSYIAKASELGFISGVGDNMFDPNGKVTYAQMGTMMVRALYSGEEENYSGGQWWECYVKAADAHGIWADTAMKDKTSWVVAADLPVDRAEMAQILYNSLVSCNVGMPTAAQISAAQSSINDYDKIPAVYRNAVLNCYALTILSGVDGGNFDPSGNMTRAQAAVVLCRVYGYVTGDVIGSGSIPTPEPVTPTDGRPEGAVGGKYDINQYTVPADTNKDGYITEAEVQAVIDRLHEEYPTGTIWGADGVGRYVSKAMGAGKGCAGWAYFVSDQIFGDLPRRQIYNIYDIRMGDLEYNNWPHWRVYLCDEVIDGVLYEGYGAGTDASANNPIHWYVSSGAYETIAESMAKGETKIYTRYPVE